MKTLSTQSALRNCVWLAAPTAAVCLLVGCWAGPAEPGLEDLLLETDYVLEYECVVASGRRGKIKEEQLARIYSLGTPIDLSEINKILSAHGSIAEIQSSEGHETHFQMCLQAIRARIGGAYSVMDIVSKDGRILWPPDGCVNARADADCSVDEFRNLLRDLEQVSASARESLIEQRIPLKGK